MTVREFWTVRTKWFCLPISADWTDVVASVRLGAGLQLLESQRKALMEILQPVGQWLNGKFWIDRKVLEKVATKLPVGADVEATIRWNPDERQADNSIVPTDEIDEFMDEMVAAGWYPTRESAFIAWRAFTSVGLKRLLLHRKPVDFGYCTIRSVPFRRGWQSDVLARCLEANVDPLIATDWLAWAITHSDNWAYKQTDGTNYFAWNLEITPSKRWRVRTAEVERLEKKENKLDEYVLQIGQWAEANRQTLFEILAQAVEEGCGPRFAVSRSSDGRLRGIHQDRDYKRLWRKATRAKIVLPKGWSSHNWRTIWQDGRPHLVPASEAGAERRKPFARKRKDGGEVGVVSSLSGLRQAQTDVRNTRSTTDQPADQSDGTAGMSLPHADQGSDGSELLDV